MKKKANAKGIVSAKEMDEAFNMLKAVNDDGKAEINGRSYVLTKTNHKKRRKVFAFYTKYQNELTAKDYSFLETDDFEVVEEIINNLVTFRGDLLSRLSDHWEKYPEDYVLFVVTMLGVISYPFFRGVVGD